MPRIARSRFAALGLPVVLGLPAVLALPAAASAQAPAASGDAATRDAAATLRGVATSLGIERITGVTIVGGGSGYVPIPESAGGNAPAAEDDPLYVPPPPPPTRRHYRIAARTVDIDLEAGTVRVDDALRAPESGAAASAADEQRDARTRYWTSPYGFVRGALDAAARVSAETIDGARYTVVSFEAEGGRAVSGYIDENGRLVRIRTTAADPDGNATDVEASLLHWETLGNVTFPTTLIRKEDGELVEVLIVRDLEVR